MLFLQERQICVFINFLTDTKIGFRNIIYAYAMNKLTCFILVSRNSDRNNLGVACMVKNSVCVVYSAIDSIRIYIFITVYIILTLFTILATMVLALRCAFQTLTAKLLSSVKITSMDFSVPLETASFFT